MALATPRLATLPSVTTPIWGMGRDGQLERVEGFELPPATIAASVAYGPPLWKLLTQQTLAKGYRRVLIPSLAETVDQVGMEVALREIPLAYAGTAGLNSLTDPSTTTKYLDASIPGGITSSELARLYMKLCWRAGLAQHPEIDGMATARVPWQRDALPLLKLQPPVYYRPGPLDGLHQGEYAYIDLTAAYWQISRVATLDMRYRPARRYLGHGIIPWYDTEDVAQLKQMRVAINGIARSSTINVVKRGVIETRQMRGGAVFLAPDLTGYLMHTMQAIAASIIDNFDCPMVLTDAYIVPAESAHDVLEFLGDYWRMPGRIEAIGQGALYAVGCYQVGAKKSKHAPASFATRHSAIYQHVPVPKAHDNIDPGVRELVKWLAERRQWLVDLELARFGLHEAEDTARPVGLDMSWWTNGAPPAQERRCDHCGWPLTTDDQRARFCSDSCSSKARGKRFRAREKTQETGEPAPRTGE